MVKRLGLLLSAAFIFSLSPATAKCAEPMADNPRVFTNDDIEKYHAPSIAAKTDPKPDTRDDRDTDRKYREKRITEEQEMEYWCKKAIACKKKIKKAEEDLKELERKISEEGTKSPRSSKKTAQRQKKLEKAAKQIKSAEEDLSELEDEAHRKGVKPGWLRCQL